MREVRSGRAFQVLMLLLVAQAWALMWLWQASPYGRYLEHGDWRSAGIGAVCAAVPGGVFVGRALIYLAGFVVMTAAMMLPTVMPLLGIFRRLTAARPDRGLLLTLVILGYLSAWTAFGLVA